MYSRSSPGSRSLWSLQKDFASNICPCVKSSPFTKLNGGLSQLHPVDVAAVLVDQLHHIFMVQQWLLAGITTVHLAPLTYVLLSTELLTTTYTSFVAAGAAFDSWNSSLLHNVTLHITSRQAAYWWLCQRDQSRQMPRSQSRVGAAFLSLQADQRTQRVQTARNTPAPCPTSSSSSDHRWKHASFLNRATTSKIPTIHIKDSNVN